ncbi:MAG: hypothetical protein U0836_16260 [Pirellulales bacterium]
MTWHTPPAGRPGPRIKYPPGGPFDHVWHWRCRLPDRKGQPCRVTHRGALNSIGVEFPDGFRVVTSRYAVRKRKP